MKQYINQISSICHLAWPAIVQEAMNVIVSYVDTAMVGALGASASAAVGLTSYSWVVELLVLQLLLELEFFRFVLRQKELMII